MSGIIVQIAPWELLGKVVVPVECFFEPLQIFGGEHSKQLVVDQKFQALQKLVTEDRPERVALTRRKMNGFISEMILSEVSPLSPTNFYFALAVFLSVVVKGQTSGALSKGRHSSFLVENKEGPHYLVVVWWWPKKNAWYIDVKDMSTGFLSIGEILYSQT